MASAIQSLIPKLNPELDAYRKFLDLILSGICREGGATYGGIVRSQYSSMPALVICSSLKTHNTVTIPLGDISPMVVAARVRESDLKFEVTQPASQPAPIQPPTLKLACLVHVSLSEAHKRDWNQIVTHIRRIRTGVPIRRTR